MPPRKGGPRPSQRALLTSSLQAITTSPSLSCSAVEPASLPSPFAPYRHRWREVAFASSHTITTEPPIRRRETDPRREKERELALPSHASDPPFAIAASVPSSSLIGSRAKGIEVLALVCHVSNDQQRKDLIQKTTQCATSQYSEKGKGWKRFEFDKDAPLEDEKIEGWTCLPISLF
ncbi:hypothetical protein AHAS_Ahas03G0209300 [Arachis hypogaea]